MDWKRRGGATKYILANLISGFPGAFLIRLRDGSRQGNSLSNDLMILGR